MYDKNHTGNLFLEICHVTLIIISAYARERQMCHNNLLGIYPRTYYLSCNSIWLTEINMKYRIICGFILMSH